jgi:peroxiredoxin
MSRSGLRFALVPAALLGVAALGAACKTMEQLPTWEEREPDSAQLAIFDADQPEPDPAAADAAAPQAAEDADPAEPAAAATAPAREPLPAPLFSDVDASCGKAPGIGQRVKSFALETPNGRPISPATYRGRVVLLNFWGTWCKPCLEELPEFSRLYRRYRKHGLTLVAVATDADAAAVQQFIDARKISAKVAIGGESAAGEYGARTFPFTFVVDGKGVIRSAYDGYKQHCMGKLESDVRAQLEKLEK